MTIYQVSVDWNDGNYGDNDEEGYVCHCYFCWSIKYIIVKCGKTDRGRLRVGFSVGKMGRIRARKLGGGWKL